MKDTEATSKKPAPLRVMVLGRDDSDRQLVTEVIERRVSELMLKGREKPQITVSSHRVHAVPDSALFSTMDAAMCRAIGEPASHEPATVGVKVLPGYEGLFAVLVEALEQAQRGKGAERHNVGGGTPFEQQRMLQISRLIDSPAGMVYQACKKITEAMTLPTVERRVAELEGAINYIAGVIILELEREPKAKQAKPAPVITGGVEHRGSDFNERPWAGLNMHSEGGLAPTKGETNGTD